MSDLDDRIAEILDAKKDADLTVPLARGRVATAISAYIREHFADHAEELGLGPEYGAQDPDERAGVPRGWYSGGGPDQRYARVHNRECAVFEADELGTRVLTRFVTQWVSD